MSRSSDAVREFHAFFGLPARTTPTVIVDDELQFRKTLIEEEYEELQEALDEGDLEAIAKEAADLLYVIYGLQWHVGIDFDKVLSIVHASNMTKLWNVECDHCDSTGIEPLPGKDLVCNVCHGAKEPRYREDGKVLKPPTYRTPKLDWLVETE